MCLGVPGQIIDILDRETQLAIAEIGGVRRPVNVACILADDQPIETLHGAWVLVHVGFALERLDEAEARATLALLAELELVDEVSV